MVERRIWRDGSEGDAPVAMALFRHLPYAAALGLVAYLRWRISEPFGEFNHVAAAALAATVWAVTVFVQFRPMFRVSGTTLSIYNYGLWPSDISLANVKNVTLGNLGPLGMIIDLRTRKNLNVREFVFLSNVDKEKLGRILSPYGITVT